MKMFRRSLLLAVSAAALSAGIASAQVSPGGVLGVRGSGSAGYPPGATPVANSATATTGGISTTINGAAGQFTYICGFSISPGSATAAITVSVTVSSLNPPLAWSVGAPVTAAGTTGAIFTQTFSPCLRTGATNTPSTLTVGALGPGGVNQSAQFWGYTQ